MKISKHSLAYKIYMSGKPEKKEPNVCEFFQRVGAIVFVYFALFFLIVAIECAYVVMFGFRGGLIAQAYILGFCGALYGFGRGVELLAKFGGPIVHRFWQRLPRPHCNLELRRFCQPVEFVESKSGGMKES